MKKILKIAIATVLSILAMVIIKNMIDSLVEPLLLQMYGHTGNITHDIASKIAMTNALIYSVIWALLFWLLLALFDSIKKPQSDTNQTQTNEKYSTTKMEYVNSVKRKPDRSKYVLIITGIILILMLIYPPFHFVKSGIELNLGYAFILNPPLKGKATINVSTLLAQCLVMTTAGLICFLAIRKRE